jgi:hypothetical protein
MATALALYNETIRLLNESYDSSLGEVGNGSGTAQVFTPQTIIAYINEAVNECCRTCIYVPAKATITQSNPIVNLSDVVCDAAYVPTPTFTPPPTITVQNDANKLWFPLTVVAGTTSLIHCSEPTLRAYSPSFESDAVGTAKYWYRLGDYSLRLYPSPATSQAITVYGAGTLAGFTIPPDDVTPPDDTLTITVIPDDLQLRMWAAYAAYKLVLKNTDDPSIASRSFWGNWYNESRMRLWSQLDTFLKMPGSPFAIPPVTGGQG